MSAGLAYVGSGFASVCVATLPETTNTKRKSKKKSRVLFFLQCFFVQWPLLRRLLFFPPLESRCERRTDPTGCWRRFVRVAAEWRWSRRRSVRHRAMWTCRAYCLFFSSPLTAPTRRAQSGPATPFAVPFTCVSTFFPIFCCHKKTEIVFGRSGPKRQHKKGPAGAVRTRFIAPATTTTPRKKTTY